jgi:hypothetical protein
VTRAEELVKKVQIILDRNIVGTGFEWQEACESLAELARRAERTAEAERMQAAHWTDTERAVARAETLAEALEPLASLYPCCEDACSHPGCTAYRALARYRGER